MVSVHSLLWHLDCFTVEQLFDISVRTKSWESLVCCKDGKPNPPPWSPCELCKECSDWWGEAADSLKDIHLNEPSSSDILGPITARGFT